MATARSVGRARRLERRGRRSQAAAKLSWPAGAVQRTVAVGEQRSDHRDAVRRNRLRSPEATLDRPEHRSGVEHFPGVRPHRRGEPGAAVSSALNRAGNSIGEARTTSLRGDCPRPEHERFAGPRAHAGGELPVELSAAPPDDQPQSQRLGWQPPPGADPRPRDRLRVSDRRLAHTSMLGRAASRSREMCSVAHTDLVKIATVRRFASVWCG
jgi:hypothetical protein